MQVVAYNKMDVPDASDYWPDMRDLLLAKQELRGSNNTRPHKTSTFPVVSLSNPNP